MICKPWRGIVVGACAPLGLVMSCLITGCAHQQASAPAAASAKTTAPAVTSASAPTELTPAAAAAQAAETEAKTHKAQLLITQVETTYKSGVDNYHGGHLEAARNDFDHAVDLMLTSGVDLKADQQLSDEFEKLLNNINSLEISALKQGTGFSTPIEAAPLDSADEVTFPPNAALTAKVQDELKTTQSDFPLVVNDYVAGFISYFSNSPTGHAHLRRSLERAGKYKEMIQRILREEGVPQDLIYLAVMESGFQPTVVNHKWGAGGMWQFMPTGAYGLARSSSVDERFDPEKSTRAYARYIKSLYNQFGDWYLAMAAYNWGPLGVQRSVARTGYADFWELYKRNNLPTETKNYVPGIIAAIIMAKNPQQYGLENLVPEDAVVTDTVKVNYAIDLRLVADITGASVPELVGLNPSLLRTVTPRDEGFDMHLPPGTRDAYLKRVAAVPEDKRSSWRFHVVRSGETLESIAGTLRTRPAEIVAANHLTSGDAVSPGAELVVPITAAATVSRPLHYVTRTGDTLVAIADRFNVSVDDLRRWNHLTSSAVAPHRTLAVTEPASHAASVTQTKKTAPKKKSSVKSH